MKDLSILIKKLSDVDFANSLTKKEKRKTFIQLYDMFDRFSHNCEFGDPFSATRAREILMACELGHTVALTYRGADGINEEGKPVEYKSTIGKLINATYNGINIFPTWKIQEEYLRVEKIGRYVEHFWARFEIGKIVEMYRATSDQALELLLPKLKRLYFSSNFKQQGDPRLRTCLSSGEIKTVAEQIM